MDERESFSSRLGFILISAGCAIGLGNVWRFPYITGKYGGAAFVLIYLLFLIILGLPVMVTELAVGRASQRSMALSFHVLEPAGSKWHWYSYLGFAGNYLLMMFYTVIAGWLLYYFVKMLRGDFMGLDSAGVAEQFSQMQARPGVMAIYMVIVVCIGMLVCAQGLPEWSGAGKQGHDAVPAGAYAGAGGQLHHSGGSGGGAEVLSSAQFSEFDV